MIGDELVEVGIGEHAARALRALADDDVAQIPRGDVGAQRLHRAAELARGLGGRAQAVGCRWKRRRFLMAGAERVGLCGGLGFVRRDLEQLALALAAAGKIGLHGSRELTVRNLDETSLASELVNAWG